LLWLEERKTDFALFATIFIPEDLGMFDYFYGFPDDVEAVGVDRRYSFTFTKFRTYRNMSYKPIKPTRE
jgi:hypothetical protein